MGIGDWGLGIPNPQSPIPLSEELKKTLFF